MMPMLDVFAPDVNFVSGRGVYPTAPGGTVANAAAPMSASTNTTVIDPQTGTPAPGSQNVVSVKGHSAFWWVGFLALLVVLVFVARKTGTEEDFRNIKPTGYNFLTITLTSVVGIVALKVLATKFKIPGASDVILAA